MIDIRRVDGLWCDDITFCPNTCGWKDCPRNKENIRDRTIPHSFSVEIPQDCPKQIRSEKVIDRNTINEFEQWCDSMNEDCPVVCLDALALLKEQERKLKRRLLDERIV